MIWELIKVIFVKMKLFIHRIIAEAEWRNENKHNDTKLGKHFFDFNRVVIGSNTYGTLNVVMHAKNATLSIGNYCSIASDVNFILSEHYIYDISTYPFKVKMLHEDSEAFVKGDIVVDDDVWLGNGATILSGVHIGQGAVVAAKAVITKDVPPYAIMGGVPARIIGYRFSENCREKLLNLDYRKISYESVKKNIRFFYMNVCDENIDEIIRQVSSIENADTKI